VWICLFSQCRRCSWVIIVCNQQMLLVERAQQPSKGKLDFPDGFVDYKESNEQALKRELLEELQLPVNNMQYLFSYPNSYLYKDVLYSTLDSCFEISFYTKPELIIQQEELSRYLWLDVSSLTIQELAFASGQHGFAEFI
jgi:NAD+ diphosphatase